MGLKKAQKCDRIKQNTMKPKARITKKGGIGKTPKKRDLFADADPLLSPFNTVKSGSYLTKNGKWESFAIIRKKEEQSPIPIQITKMPEITIKGLQNKAISESGIKTGNVITIKEPHLDSQNRILKYGEILHKFQRGRENNYVYQLFKKLWEERRRIDSSGKPLKQGEIFPPEALAVQAAIIQSASEFQNPKVKIQFNNAIKSIRKILNKGFPIKLVGENGIQLIVTVRR